MTKLEQLRLDYLSAKQEMEAYQSDEKCAHKKVIEYEEKMSKIKKEIKEVGKQESEERIKEVLESALIIKEYCAETQCKNCKFYTGNQSIYARCSLMNTNPTQWQI